MEFLSEDPTYLVWGLGLVAAGLLIALKVTQQGKYLLWASATVGLALLALLVEWFWTTDNERIEQAVYGLARAVAASDVDTARTYLSDDVRYVRGGTALKPAETRARMTDLLANARFDFLRVNELQANAGARSRRGTAEFRVLCGGSIQQNSFTYNFGSTRSAWSLGLKETSPGVWKVNRITPVEVPRGENVLPR